MPGYKHKGGYTRHKDLTGQVFYNLTVIELAEPIINKNGEKSARWKCLCKCGNTVIVRGNSLSCGKTKSCGCLNRTKPSNNRKHCMSNSRIYSRYKAIKQRCFNENSTGYKDYGARGITMCDEWLGERGFENFYNWSMANGYNDDLSIERVDVNGNYCPENCMWISKDKQAHNKRNTFIVNGVRVAEEARKLGIVTPHIARERCKLGWDVESAISIPKRGA